MKRRSPPTTKKRPGPKRQKAVSNNSLQVVFTSKQIQKRVQDLAKQMTRDYQGKTLHVFGILDNCFMFMADLVRAVKVPVICHFLRTEIRDGMVGKADVREIQYTPKVEATGKDILLLDGILQSGVTLDHLYRCILAQNPSSIRTATLVEKTDERKVEVATDYVGFQTTGKFLIGYGLGHKENYRNLPYIARLN